MRKPCNLRRGKRPREESAIHHPSRKRQRIQKSEEALARSSLFTRRAPPATTKAGSGSHARADSNKLCILDLPGEIRNMVYAELLPAPATRVFFDFGQQGRVFKNIGRCFLAEFLRVNRQINYEAASFLYGQTLFVFPGIACAFPFFCSTIGSKNASFIRQVRVLNFYDHNHSISRWIPRFFYEERLWSSARLVESARNGSFLTALTGLSSLKFSWSREIDVEVASWSIYCAIREWIDAVGRTEGNIFAALERVTVITWEDDEKHDHTDEARKYLMKLSNSAPVSTRLRSHTRSALGR